MLQMCQHAPPCFVVQQGIAWKTLREDGLQGTESYEEAQVGIGSSRLVPITLYLHVSYYITEE